MASRDIEKRAGGAGDVILEEQTSSSFKASSKRFWRFTWLHLLPFVCLLLVPLTFRCSRHNAGRFSGGLGRPDTLAESVALVEDETPPLQPRSASTSSAAAAPTVLECFQVAQPVLVPQGASYQSVNAAGSSVKTEITNPAISSQESCTVLLMDHIFANSYGQPFFGNYTPPSCKFNRVVMNFTVVSEGRQYDRLALMYFGDTEVWRTSTAEPTQAPGIRWTYVKDMTEYLYFWDSPQTIIFDLGNLVNDIYTASLNTTLTANFFWSDVDTAAAPPSDLIIPISARNGASGGASQFTVPSQNATNTFSLPRNANHAVFSVSACGQSTEEFWWSNVLQSDIYEFNSTYGLLYGFSPFREAQVFIDGRLAGVQWPFPVIFTGGVVPGIHRPIVGVDDFDLREHEIDITPWLPYLSDGKEHTFTIEIAGLNDSGTTTAIETPTVGADWYVTGKIFLWLDEDPHSVTTGTSPPSVELPAPQIAVSQSSTQDATGANETLSYTVEVKRTMSVSALVRSQQAAETVTWSQDLAYSNWGYLYDYGFGQINAFSTNGTDKTIIDGDAASPYYASSYQYPLWCNQTYTVSPEGNLTIWARVIQGLDLDVAGAAVFPTGLEAFEAGVPRTFGSRFAASQLSTTLDGQASFFEYADDSYSYGFGSTNQVFAFAGTTADDVLLLQQGTSQELYFRNVTAVNGSVTFDLERIAGQGAGGGQWQPGGIWSLIWGLFPLSPGKAAGKGWPGRI